MAAFRLGSGNLKRRGNFRDKNRLVLIITNGEKTEPIYFENFKKKSKFIKIEIRKESGSDPVTLIKFASRIKDAYDADRIYCIYDVDDSSDDLLNKAKKIATKNGLTSCISNPCFEIWFLFHYENHKSILNGYAELEKRLLNFIPDYKKNLDIFDRLQPLQPKAILNARDVMRYHITEGNISSIRKQNPSTQVHELIEDLMNLVK